MQPIKLSLPSRACHGEIKPKMLSPAPSAMQASAESSHGKKLLAAMLRYKIDGQNWLDRRIVHFKL